MKFLWIFFAVLIHGCACPGLAWTQASSKVVQVDQASGVSSTPNYWKTGDAEFGLAGVSTYNDGDVAKPVDCTGGTADRLSVAKVSPAIYDKQSWYITKTAFAARGQGVAFEFDVDNGIAAVEMMDLMFDYIVGSGTFAAGSDTTNSDLMVYLYDVTAGALIEPKGGSKLYTSSTTLKGDYRGWFQSTLGSKKYRVCLHQATTSASAYTLKVDAGKVQKSKQVVGTIISEWTNYTPTISAASGTLTNYTVSETQWIQVGPNAYYRGRITFTGSPGTWSGPQITLPAGQQLKDIPDIRILPSTVDMNPTGVGANRGNAYVWAMTPTIMRLVTDSGSGPASITQAAPFTWASGNSMTWTVGPVPIQGWSAGARMSDGYDGRDIAGLFTGLSSTLSLTTTNQTINFIKVRDEAETYSSGVYTVKTSGWYEAEAGIGLTNLTGASTLGSAVARLTLYMGGESSIYEANAINTTSLLGTPSLKTSKKAYLIAGQTIYAQARVIGTSAANVTTFSDSNYLTIIKSSGTPFMSPTALWETRYAGTAGDAIGTSDSLIKFTTKVEDTFGSYDPFSGLWKAKGPATCSAAWRVASAPVNLSTSQVFYSSLHKSGVYTAAGSVGIGNGVSNAYGSVGSLASVKVNTGDTLAVYAQSSVATTAGASQTGNYFTVSCRQ